MQNSKVFGSTLIIAGTSIGAGMLALPLASAGLGCGVSIAIMLVMWGLMAYTALLMLEVHQYAAANATLHTLAQLYLGNRGKLVATFAMFFLFYSLCAAYIAGGGSQFNVKLNSWFALDLPPALGTVLFALLVAAIVSLGTGSVDMVNRLLFSLKIIALALLLYFLSSGVSENNLRSMPVQNGLILSALPVIFTSFGFHGSIPAVVRYLDCDIKSLRRVIVLGSALPFFIYLLWVVVSLGSLPQELLLQSQTLGSLVAALSGVIQNSKVTEVVSIFADLALLTSFLGVSLGLYEFLEDALRKRGYGNRVFVGVATFLPPLAFALFYPQGFIMALGYAAIALAILAVLLPVAMIIALRKKHDSEGHYRVQGGSLALGFAGLAGVIIIVAQLCISMGFLPSIG